MTGQNTNCLAGMRCPACGSYGPFRIAATVLVLMDDEGTIEDLSGSEWENASHCACQNCDHPATVADFTEKEAV